MASHIGRHVSRILVTLICALVALHSTIADSPRRPSFAPGETNWQPRAESRFIDSGLVTADLLSGLTRADLVDLLIGPGVTVFDVRGSGTGNAAGTFSGGADIIGFESGIILSSGNIASVVGPNFLDDVTTNNGQAGDPDLSALSGFISLDASVLEFDFACPFDRFQVSYVFASDEYNEYVFSPYNDVFGFIVNGVNVATVPDSGQPINVNAVNCDNPYDPATGDRCAFFINNDCSDIPPGGFPCSGNRDTEMDGLTRVLTATGSVQPGVNTIKLAVSDATDSIFDTNVFLELGSFVCCGVGPDSDGDGETDVCDPCPFDPLNRDKDADGVCDDADGSGIAGDNPCTGAVPADPCDDNCRRSNPGQEDVDADGYGDLCDNCPDEFNPGQEDDDGDLVGNLCDNCPQDFNPSQSDCDDDGEGDACDENTFDPDEDGVDEFCDNCPGLYNPFQVDSDGDGEGDLCDLNDGLLYFTDMTPTQQTWQDEHAVYSTYNLYRGDLALLRATGEYTQDPLAVPNAALFCDLGIAHTFSDAFVPPEDEGVFYLVTGAPSVCGDSSLGRDSSGDERRATRRCLGSGALTIDFDGPGKYVISLPRTVLSPSVTHAQELYDAMEDAGLEPVSVAVWAPTIDDWYVWEPPTPAPSFAIDPWQGLAYRVEIADGPGQLVFDGIDCTSEVLLLPPILGEGSGLNAVSLPFLSPLNDASDLLDDVGPNAMLVARYVTGADALQSYDGTAGTAFPIVPGEGYLVRVMDHTPYTPSIGSMLTSFALATVLTAGVMVESHSMTIVLLLAVVVLAGVGYLRRNR